MLPIQDIELEETEGDEIDPEDDENVDPAIEHTVGKIKLEENKEEKETTDINKEYDMDNYDDGKFQSQTLLGKGSDQCFF